MAHLKHSENRASNTPPEWLGVGRAIGELANKWSERHDLVGYVGTNAGHGAPACYNPALAEIEVDTAIAFGAMVSPEQVGDLTQRATQFEFAKATGAIMHEAFHAKFSHWDLEKAYKDLESDEHQALILLEESRIEAQGLLAMPDSLNFLRACAMDIVIADAKEKFETSSNTQSAAFLVATVHARIDAGILDESEVKDLVELVDAYMSPEVIEKLRAIAHKFQAHTMHANAELLYPLAKEWAQIIRDVAEEKGDAQGQDGKPESGEAGEGSGGMSKEFAKMLMDALEEAGAEISIGNADALAEQEQGEEWQQEVKDKQAEADERKKNEDTAKQVFEKSTGVGDSKSSSRLQETRKPTAEERIAAVQIAQLLEKAKYRERDAVEIASITPPGRLRTRQMVQANALRERGVMQQVAPFRRTVRKHTDDPTLTVGVMVDISASMGSAMNPMATTAWVMSEAVRRVQGKCAMVYYGNDVFATLKSGQHLEEVNVYSASDGTEKFDKAFRALDGSLNLLNGSGARLLVVVSDAQYTPEERELARKWIARCNDAGVAILWLPFDGGHYAERLTRHGKVAVMSGVLDPTGAASEIGRRAAGELTNVGRLNA
jgi:hypothetical protein